ncbi:MAG: cupin, partial [Pseudomonadota bacterium]
MDPILVEHNPSPAKLDVIGVYDWPIWNKEPSTFPWT